MEFVRPEDCTLLGRLIGWWRRITGKQPEQLWQRMARVGIHNTTMTTRRKKNPLRRRARGFRR